MIWLLGLGLIVLVVGAELLVRNSAKLAVSFGVKPLLVGLIFVSYGTGAPEIAIMVDSMNEKHQAIGFGNIIGSNILNILLILGICALISPIKISQKLVKVDVSIMIAISALFYVLAYDGQIGLLDGWILFLGMIAYTFYTIYESRREKKEIEAEYAKEYGKKLESANGQRKAMSLFFVLIGIGLVVIGAHLTVIHSSELARSLGISELVIGLTLVAIGTSLPEIVTGVMAMIRKEPDIATGTIIGSNIVNLLGVIGISVVLTQTHLMVPQGALSFDIPFMIVVAMACLPLFSTGYRIDRWEGFLFIGYFAMYMTYVWMKSVEHDALPMFSNVLMGFSLPLAFTTLFVIVKRSIHKRYPVLESLKQHHG